MPNYTNSPLVTYTRISPNRTINRNHAIDTITIHCYVGQVTAQRGCNGSRFIKKDSKNGASCNYVVGYDGSVGLCVEEKDRSWCSSNRDNDHRAITIEVASETKSPYVVTDQAMAALIDLIVDICKRNKINKLIWSANKNDRVNHLNGCNMTIHRDYSAKACPGDYLYGKHPYIAAEVNKRLSGATENTSVTQPEAQEQPKVPFKVKVVVSDLNYRSEPSMNGKALGVTGKGVFTITETKEDWGKLKSNAGWIYLGNPKYTQKI